MDGWKFLGLKEPRCYSKSPASIYVELFLWLQKTLSNNEKAALVILQLQFNLLLAYNAINQKQLFEKKKNPVFNPFFDSALLVL